MGPRTDAVAVAPCPSPPTIEIDGCDVYPVPPSTIRTRETTPLVIIAVAEAPEPPPPTIETRGEDVYPLPPLSTVISLIEPLTVTEAEAPEPPPPEIVIVGGNAAS